MSPLYSIAYWFEKVAVYHWPFLPGWAWAGVIVMLTAAACWWWGLAWWKCLILGLVVAAYLFMSFWCWVLGSTFRQGF